MKIISSHTLKVNNNTSRKQRVCINTVLWFIFTLVWFPHKKWFMNTHVYSWILMQISQPLGFSSLHCSSKLPILSLTWCVLCHIKKTYGQVDQVKDLFFTINCAMTHSYYKWVPVCLTHPHGDTWIQTLQSWLRVSRSDTQSSVVMCQQRQGRRIDMDKNIEQISIFKYIFIRKECVQATVCLWYITLNVIKILLHHFRLILWRCASQGVC